MNASQLHTDALLWDAHRDVAYEIPLTERFLEARLMGVDLHLSRVKKGEVNAVVYALCLAPEVGLHPTAQALKELDQVLESIETCNDQVILAKTTQDVLLAKREDKIAAILSLEGAEPILVELGLLRVFYRLGFRNMGLTWNFRNPLADGISEGGEGGGLSLFGRAVIKEMNRLGMMVDLAHLAPAGMRDVLAISERPVIYSHGGTHALCPHHPRPIYDEMLEAIAKNGGVFCVAAVVEFLAARREDANLEIYLDHLDHAVQVMGIDHVGLGPDFDVYHSHLGLAEIGFMKDLVEADDLPKVTAGLLDRGYSESDTRKILGENLFRVFKQVIG